MACTTDIRFGTSGWRGQIARDFTFANVRRLAWAIGRWLSTQGPAPASGRGGRKASPEPPPVFVAYDTRHMAEAFALEAARVLSAQGRRVLLAGESTPTPAVSAFVRARHLAGAINFTASHNPCEWQGMKWTTQNGAPAPSETTRAIEALIPKDAKPLHPPQGSGGRAGRQGKNSIKHVSAKSVYFRALRRAVDFERIRRAGLRVAVDAMHGAASGWLDGVLREEGIPHAALRTERDVLFGGAMPDPAPERLRALGRRVRKEGAALGLAADGDADRFGVLDGRGAFVSPNLVVAMLCDYVLRHKGAPTRRGLARTVVTTHLVDDVARWHGVEVFETPVGFKHIGEKLLRGEAVAGGEESAGFSTAAHLPEKDGIFAGLLVLDMVAREGKPFAALARDFFARLGTRRASARMDVHGALRNGASSLRRKSFAGLRVLGTERADGIKWRLEGGAWLALRRSGTEPLVRLYAEAPSRAMAEKLLRLGKSFVREDVSTS
jgi:phosphoglucomutase